MKRHLLRRGAVAGALVLACGGSVLAQSVPAPSPSPAMPSTLTPGLPASGLPASATQSTTQPPPNPSTYGGQGYAPVPASPVTVGTGQLIPDARTLSRSDDAATAFRALDPMNRGYVTRADVDKINGFRGFDNADTDRDGRLTPEEFYNAWKFFAQ